MVRPSRLALAVDTSRSDAADPGELEGHPRAGAEAPGRPLDAIALGAAFEREAPILLAAARAITFDAAEAEDLVQTTFETAIRNAHQLRDPNALRAWLLTIQTREALRVVRRLRRTFAAVARGGVVEVAVRPIASTDRIVIRDALRALPPRMRTVVVLHHMAGMTVPQVALAVGRSENTVRSQLRVGLQRLREALRDD